MADSIAMMRENIKVMNVLDGFDVVIICCSSEFQAEYWQTRLENGRGSILSSSSIVLAVQEDWPGGAGNALGTLYAYQNAAKLALEKFETDIVDGLNKGTISVGLYHTAGKGTRLAPLPGAENNNKPGVKLPAVLKLATGQNVPITILESVIKQTGCYAKSRKGRLSVFWGDQVFIPTVPVEYRVTHHVDILCSLGPMLSETEWREKGMEKYGLIAQSSSGEGAQVEKVDHATAVQLLSSLGEIQSVGASLGSFSVSSSILAALMSEFAVELASKSGKLDSDPHLWMPMTLDKPAYLQLMGQKGISAETAGAHYDRIKAMMTTFLAVEENKSLGLFGPVNVGQGVCWWDYGQLPLFQKYALLTTTGSDEAGLMRKFFGFGETLVVESEIVNTDVSTNTSVSASTIGATSRPAGFVRDSVLCGVRCNHIEAEGAVLINVTADKIIAAPGSVVYNIADAGPAGLVVAAGEVLAGVYGADGVQQIVRSNLSIDGGKAWENVLPTNLQSFEQIYNSNTEARPLVLEGIITAAHDAAWSTVAAEEDISNAAKKLKSDAV